MPALALTSCRDELGGLTRGSPVDDERVTELLAARRQAST